MIDLNGPVLGFRERYAVVKVLKSGMISQGPEVALFEAEFTGRLLDGRAAIAVNSGTSALHLGMLAAGIGPGDEVIVPSFTFAATPNSVSLTGAVPVFCDVDPVTYTLDPEHARTLIGPRTKAIMPVHLYGHPAPMAAVQKLADEHGLLVFEDAAQAHGAEILGRKVGTFGEFAMFSFYPTKNMTTGEGGLVSTGNEHLARMVRMLRNQGMEVKYQNEIVGFNNRLTDIGAAIGRVQLRKVERWIEVRRRNAKYLSDRIEGFQTPSETLGFKHVYNQYTIRVPENRSGVAQALSSEYGIATAIYYPVPTHRLPSMRFRQPQADLPETEKAAREVLSLPVHPSLKKAHLDRIVKALDALARAGS